MTSQEKSPLEFLKDLKKAGRFSQFGDSDIYSITGETLDEVIAIGEAEDVKKRSLILEMRGHIKKVEEEESGETEPFFLEWLSRLEGRKK